MGEQIIVFKIIIFIVYSNLIFKNSELFESKVAYMINYKILHAISFHNI